MALPIIRAIAIARTTDATNPALVLLAVGSGGKAFVQAFSTIPEIGAAIWTVIHRRGDLGEDATDCPAVKAGEGLFVTGRSAGARAKWARTAVSDLLPAPIAGLTPACLYRQVINALVV